MLQLLLLLLFLPNQAMCTSDGVEMTGAVDGAVTFHFQHLEDQRTAWSFEGETIATVKSGDPPEVAFFDDYFKPRLAFPNNGTALTISQLTMADAGTYIAKTAKTRAKFILHVYMELAVPSVSCLEQNCSSGVCKYTLLCSVLGSGYGHVSYEWSTEDLPWIEGPTVLVERDEESPLEEVSSLTCMARNPVSNSSITVLSPSALCAGTYSRVSAGLMAVSVIGAVALVAAVLVAAVTAVICCRSKGWKIFRLPAVNARSTEAGTEYSTVYAQVGPSQQVHMERFPCGRQNDPKKAPTPNAGTSKTIYLTAQAVAQTDDEKMGNSRLRCQEEDEKTIYEVVRQPQHSSSTSLSLL